MFELDYNKINKKDLVNLGLYLANKNLKNHLDYIYKMPVIINPLIKNK